MTVLQGTVYCCAAMSVLSAACSDRKRSEAVPVLVREFVHPSKPSANEHYRLGPVSLSLPVCELQAIKNVDGRAVAFDLKSLGVAIFAPLNHPDGTGFASMRDRGLIPAELPQDEVAFKARMYELSGREIDSVRDAKKREELLTFKRSVVCSDVVRVEILRRKEFSGLLHVYKNDEASFEYCSADGRWTGTLLFSMHWSEQAWRDAREIVAGMAFSQDDMRAVTPADWTAYSMNVLQQARRQSCPGSATSTSDSE